MPVISRNTPTEQITVPVPTPVQTKPKSQGSAPPAVQQVQQRRPTQHQPISFGGENDEFGRPAHQLSAVIMPWVPNKPKQLSRIKPKRYSTEVTEEDFHKLLDANPDDHHTRLVFADWLQERNDPRAEGYRALVQLKKRPNQSRYSPDDTWVWGRNENSSHNYTWYGINGALPESWLRRIINNHPRYDHDQYSDPNNNWRYHTSRRNSEDAAALAFSSLPKQTKNRLLKPKKLSRKRIQVITYRRPNLTPAQKDRAKKVELVVLPKSISGKSCGSCKYGRHHKADKSGGNLYCFNNQVHMNVKTNWGCKLWDHKGVKRLSRKVIRYSEKGNDIMDNLSDKAKKRITQLRQRIAAVNRYKDKQHLRPPEELGHRLKTIVERKGKILGKNDLYRTGVFTPKALAIAEKYAQENNLIQISKKKGGPTGIITHYSPLIEKLRNRNRVRTTKIFRSTQHLRPPEELGHRLKAYVDRFGNVTRRQLQNGQFTGKALDIAERYAQENNLIHISKEKGIGPPGPSGIITRYRSLQSKPNLVTQDKKVLNTRDKKRLNRIMVKKYGRAPENEIRPFVGQVGGVSSNRHADSILADKFEDYDDPRHIIVRRDLQYSNHPGGWDEGRANHINGLLPYNDNLGPISQGSINHIDTGDSFRISYTPLYAGGHSPETHEPSVYSYRLLTGPYNNVVTHLVYLTPEEHQRIIDEFGHR
jgi:uncharacterized protein (TIGR02996 family)